MDPSACYTKSYYEKDFKLLEFVKEAKANDCKREREQSSDKYTPHRTGIDIERLIKEANENMAELNHQHSKKRIDENTPVVDLTMNEGVGRNDQPTGLREKGPHSQDKDQRTKSPKHNTNQHNRQAEDKENEEKTDDKEGEAKNKATDKEEHKAPELKKKAPKRKGRDQETPQLNTSSGAKNTGDSCTLR